MPARINYMTTGDGKRIAYSLEGKKGAPTILLINSIATTMHMWDTNMADFLSEYQVLRYDLRGHGMSDAPAEPYSIDRLGYDVIEMLDTLHIERVHVLGFSFGGLVAQWLAIYAPERIDKLILASTASHLDPRQLWDELIVKARNAVDMSEFADMFLHNWFPQAMLEAHAPAIDPFKRDLLAMSTQGLAGTLAAIRDTDLRRVTKLITAPTLVIGGKYDVTTRPEFSRDIAASVPNATLRILPSAHLSSIQFPKRFARLVLEFFS